MGTPEFAVPSLDGLIHDERFEIVGVVTQPDRPRGRGQKMQMSPVREIAQKYSLRTFQPEKVKNNPELITDIKTLSPDIIVVAAYGKILPQEFLDIGKIVNIHGSFLPKYRGASPIAAAILNGEQQTGITLMEMTLGMDEGPIIAMSDPVDIDRLDTTKSLSGKMSQVGAKLLINKLPDYLAGKISPAPQDDTQATYTKLIKKEDGQIDWGISEIEIVRHIMAMNPWPSAYTRLSLGDARDSSKLLKLLEAEYIESSDIPKNTVAQVGGEMMIGHIRILRVQLEGRSAMSGSEFIRGYPGMIGYVFA